MALTKTLWTSIVNLVSTGQNVSDNLDTAFTNIDAAITQVDTNTSDLVILNDLNNFEYTKVTGHTVTSTSFEAVASIYSIKDAGTYTITQSMLYSLDSTTTSAYFRFSTDGGTNWVEVRREPKDNTDKEPMCASYVLVHAGGAMDIQIESRKENSGDVLEIFSLDLMVERKA